MSVILCIFCRLYTQQRKSLALAPGGDQRNRRYTYLIANRINTLDLAIFARFSDFFLVYFYRHFWNLKMRRTCSWRKDLTLKRYNIILLIYSVFLLQNRFLTICYLHQKIANVQATYNERSVKNQKLKRIKVNFRTFSFSLKPYLCSLWSWNLNQKSTLCFLSVAWILRSNQGHSN